MFVTVTTKHVCGIDLHARTMSVCVMTENGLVVLKKTIDCSITTLLECLKPFIRSITVGVESTFNWYWLIDGLKRRKIPVIWVIPSISNS
jgi:hypothetical protein